MRAMARDCIGLSPALASHFPHGELQQISLQLQRSAPVALSIRLEHTSARVVDLLLTESRRWQNLHLNFYSTYDKNFATSKLEFPVLEKVTLVIRKLLPKDIALSLFFPALVDFTLDVNQAPFPDTLNIIWAQLRICRLTNCCTADLLPVLALFSTGTRVCLEHFYGGGEQLTSVRTVISDLSLCCYNKEDIHHLLGALTAPCLKIFCIAGQISIPRITAFFDRSLCTLTHLGVDWNDSLLHFADLLPLLRSPHASNIVDLDADLRAPDAEKLAGALADDGIVPKLRTLALGLIEGSHRDGTIASVLEMHAKRRPIFQSLWLNSCGFPSQDTLQALKMGGLEVVLFEPRRWAM